MAINLNLPKLFKQFDNAEWTKEQFLAATESDDYKDLICLDSNNGWLAKNGVMYGSGSDEALDLFANVYVPEIGKDGKRKLNYLDFVEHITVSDLARKLTYKDTPLKATITIDSELVEQFTLVDKTRPTDKMNVCAIVYSDDSEVFVSNKLRKMPIPKMCAVYFGQLELDEELKPIFDPEAELTIFRHYTSDNMPVAVLKRLGIYSALTSPKITVPTAINNNRKYRKSLIGTVHNLVRKSILNDKVTKKSALINPFVNSGDSILIDGSGVCRSLGDFFLSLDESLYGSKDTLDFIKTRKAQYGYTLWVDLVDHVYSTIGVSKNELERDLLTEQGKVVPKIAGKCNIQNARGRLSCVDNTLTKKILISKDMFNYLDNLPNPAEAVIVAKVQCYEIKDDGAEALFHKTLSNESTPVYTFVIKAEDFVPCTIPGINGYYEFDCGNTDEEGKAVSGTDFISIKKLYIPVNMNDLEIKHSVQNGAVLYHYSNHYVNYAQVDIYGRMNKISNSLIDHSNHIDFKLAVTQKMECADVILPIRGGIIMPSVNRDIDISDNTCQNPRLYKYVKSEEKAIKAFDELCKKATSRKPDAAGDGIHSHLNAFEQFEKYMFSQNVALYAKWQHGGSEYNNGEVIAGSKSKFMPITMTRTRKFFDRTATANLERKGESSTLTSKKYMASNFVYGAQFPGMDSGIVYKLKKESEKIMAGQNDVSKNYLARLFSKLMFANARLINENAETDNWAFRNKYLGDIDRYHKVKYVDVIAMPIVKRHSKAPISPVSACRAKYFAPKYGRKFRIKFDMSEFTMEELNELLQDVNSKVHNVQVETLTYQAYGDANNKNAFVDAITKDGVTILGKQRHIRVSVIDMGFDLVQ